MAPCFWTQDRVKAFTQSIVGLPEWLEVSRYFRGRIRLASEASSVVLDMCSGETKIMDHPDLVTDLVVKGPASDWLRVANGELDWFQATTPGHGNLVIEGEPIFAMRNIKILWLAFKAIAQPGSGRKPVDFSPPAPARQARVLGHYVEVDGLDIYYEEAGCGPALLCLHAACQDTLMYRHVLAGLSDEYRVIAIDAPGHGKSQMPNNGPFRDLTTHAAFNERTMEVLGVERPVIIGCSMAGNQVLELAARRPGTYAAVISSEGADYTPGLDDFVLDMLMINGQQLLECYSQSLTGNRTPPDRAREVVWQLRRTTPEIMRSDLGAYSGFDKRDQMGRITDPVLLLRGNEDWLVSQEQVEATASRIKDSKIAILEGTGHYPMIENPTEFNDAVRKFLHELRIGQNC